MSSSVPHITLQPYVMSVSSRRGAGGVEEGKGRLQVTAECQHSARALLVPLWMPVLRANTALAQRV